MRTFCVVCVIGLLMHCAMACSAPQPRIEKAPLVERGEQASTQCTGADWRAARLCDDEACAAAALGATCSECLSELTPDTCNACLGERLCAHSDNMEIAQRVTKPHANALPDVRAHKVGRFPIGGLEGASRRGQELVVVGAGGLLGESRRSSASMPDLEAVVTPFQHSVLTAQDELLWQIPGTLDECLAATVSPMGRWVATVCGASIRVYALATGFLHHELQLAEAVEPSGHLELSNLSPLYHCFGGDGWLALPTTQGWSRINLDDGGRTTIANAGDSAAMNAFRLDDDDFRVALAWDGSHVAVGSRHGASIEVLTVDGSAASKIDTGAVVNDFAFDGSRSLIVSTTDNFARYDLTGAQVG